MHLEAWLAEAELQGASQRETCLVAAWATGPEAAQALLLATAAATGLAVWNVQAWQQASAFLAANAAHETEAVALVAALAPDKPLLFGARVQSAQPTSLREALLLLAPPVFAVLDGAQFDDLPRQLLLGGFVSRPLYLDRGDNNPGQVITAPHMVWLDERLEKATGRAPDAVIPALLDLVGDRPAAVFWQCPEGAEALYRHLRGINMVMIPAEVLPEGDPATEADDAPALFRHADANVMAQIEPCLTAPGMARILGPAEAILFLADPIWSPRGCVGQIRRNTDLRDPAPGMWRVSIETLRGLERFREECLRRKAVRDFTEPDSARGGFAAAPETQIVAAFDRARSYGLGEMSHIWDFIALDVQNGPGFELRPENAEAYHELTHPEQLPVARIHYARLALQNR
jgi:hypothetical protein